jgi:hypothetical protein
MDNRKTTHNLDPDKHLIEFARREDALIAEVKAKLPDFVVQCNAPVAAIILHQDAFAADYEDDEFRLLGMAIKYAGLNGKEIHILGHNRETLTRNS